MKTTKKALFSSVVALVLCFSMFIGTTMAWFTDSVSSGVNQIIAGNLDIEVSYKDGATWKPLQDATSLFSTQRWEPGHTEYVVLKVENKGTLGFNYKMMVSPVSENGGINVAGDSFKLSDYLVFGTTAASAAEPSYADRTAARAAVGVSMRLNQESLTQSGSMTAGGAAQYITLVVYMPETVGNEANYKTGTTAPFINMGITVLATQMQNESDSFGNNYDQNADLTPDYPNADIPQYGVVEAEVVRETVPASGDTVFTCTITPSQDDASNTTVTVPEGTSSFVGGQKVELKVEAAPAIAASGLFTLSENQSAVGSIDLSVTVSDADGSNAQVVSRFVDDSGEAKTVMVKTYVAKNLTNVSLSYGDESWVKVDAEAEVEAGKFYYDPVTGKLVFGTVHFSTFVVHADEAVYVNSKDSAYKTIAEAFNAAATDDVVVLLKDTTTDNVSTKTAASVTLDLNKKTLTLNGDLTFGDSQPVTETIINGHIVAANSGGDEYTIGFTGGSSGTFSNVTFKSNHPDRSTKILSVYASASNDQNRYRFDSCAFDNATVSFGGAAGASYSFDTAFARCGFNNMKFVSGYGDSVVTFDSYVYGSAKFLECSFDITSVRNGSSAATAIRSDVLASYVGSNKLNITLNNVTIAGTTANSSSTFYPLTIRNETSSNCPTVVTKTGTNTFTRNGAKATMTANSPVYSVSYLYNTTPKTENWASVNGKLIYATNSYSKYDVVITLLEDSGESMTLSGQRLIVPAGLSYTGTVTAAAGYTIIEETGADGVKTYASVQAEFNGKQCTIIEAQKAMQDAGSGTIKLLADGVSFGGSYKLGPTMTIDLNGHTAKNKPTPATNYAIKLENGIYSVVTAVAKANNTNYASLAEAAAAVTVNNPTITLLSDCSDDLELPVAITNRVKLDTNGKNYTGTVTVPEGYQLMHVGNVYAIAVVKVTIGDSEPVYYIYDNTPRATTSGTAAYAIANATEDCIMEILVDYNHVSVNGLWLVAPSGHTLTVKTNGHMVTGGVNANSGNTKVDNGDGTYTITRK